MRQEAKRIRNMKVCEQSGYHYKATPATTLKGQWLETFGFCMNMPITVRCEQGRLVIELRDASSEAELPVGLVAEEKGGYGA